MSSQHKSKAQSRDESLGQSNPNGHALIEVTEWIPGREPTDYGIELIEGPPYEYQTRFWRCRNCGQERNRRSEFREHCEAEHPPTPLSDGGYSIEDARTRRALTEDMDIQFGNYGPVYEVRSQSGSTYEVNVEAGMCSCPDFQKRHESLGEQGCKHLRRVTLEIRTRQLPQPDGTFQKRFSRP